MRQLEGEQNNLRELLEEEEESKRNVEKQVSALQCQVSPPGRPLEALVCGVEILKHVPLSFMCKSSLLSGPPGFCFLVVVHVSPAGRL